MLDAENPAENPDPTTAAETEEQRNAAVDAPAAAPNDTAEDAAAADEAAAAHEAPAAAADEVDAAAAAPEDAPMASAAPAKKTTAKRAAVKKTAAKKTAAKKTAAKKTAARRSTRKAAQPPGAEAAEGEAVAPEAAPEVPPEVGPEAAKAEAHAEVTTEQAFTGTSEADAESRAGVPAVRKTAKRAAKKAPAKRVSKKAAAAQKAGEASEEAPLEQPPTAAEAPAGPEGAGTDEEQAAAQPAAPGPATALLFQPPDPTKAVVTRRRRAGKPEAPAVPEAEGGGPVEATEGEERPKLSEARAEKGEPAEPVERTKQQADEAGGAEGEEEQGGERRRRRRGGRRRRRGGGEENGSTEGAEGNDEGTEPESSEQAAESDEGEEATSAGSRRRRRRRRSGESADGNGDETEGTTGRTRKPRNAEDEITSVTGSTRLEAKKQRRREGREAGRRRAPIVSEAEFLARRESVDRVMVIRQRQDLTQIAVLEDKVLVEHYVARESQTSLIGNVYLGRVQNVLPSMEAAFVDIGKGRNAVLYAGEVNWEALGAKNGSPRKIEQVLKSGQTVLVQVTKDPVGHKGARLTSQISLPGRFLVYVPDGTTSGISRKLPDTERNRLKNLLKDIVPDTAGVIVRTASEGASEEELTRDVERLRARWEDIEKKASSGNAPQLLYGEPDLTLKVVRDLFTEDFNKLVISGGEAWEMVDGYVSHVAPDLADRLEKHDGERDVFAEYRIDEQIEKALDRKVWLPSGGSLVIDRTEAMTVVDVNTGKFTGSGGNLEETVTKNNLEAAEEIVRQLRLRDIGGIIVVDFIDMVLESNRDLVLRRLVECLGRDRTRHQVAEVTSLGLVQMTRKRIGTGLLEAFSETCEHCGGRGLVLHHEPVESRKKADEESRRSRRGGRGRGRDEAAAGGGQGGGIPSPKEVAAMARHEEKPGEERQGEERQDEPETAEAREQTVRTETGREETAPEAAARTPEAEAAVTPETEAAATQEAEAAAGEPANGQVGELTEPQRPGRGRGGRGRGGRGLGEASPEDHGPAEAPPQEQAPPEAPPQDQAPPEAPLQEQGRRPEGAPLEPAPTEQVESGAETPSVQEATEQTEPAVQGVAEPVEPSATSDGVGAPTGAEQATNEGARAEPAAPAAPTVVTTVRRRSARRPAGPPSVRTAPDTSTASASSGSIAVDESADDDRVDEPGDVDPLATLVDESEEPPSPDGDDPGDAGSDSHATPHVPVKRRGSRRR